MSRPEVLPLLVIAAALLAGAAIVGYWLHTDPSGLLDVMNRCCA